MKAHSITRIISHRACAGHAPENTLAGIRAAVSLAADMIEMDVQVTRDNHFVLFHDKLLSRTTGFPGYLADYSLAELEARVRLGNGESIPTLETVCRELRSTPQILVIEIVAPGIEKDVINLIRRFFPPERLLVASFHHGVLVNVKQHDPEISVMALLEGSPVNLAAMLADAQCDWIGLGWESVATSAIEAAWAQQVKVAVWTLNQSEEIKRAVALSVDALFTDFPERAHAILNKVEIGKSV